MLGWFYLSVLPDWLGLDTADLNVSLWEIAKSVLIFLGIPLLAGYLTRTIGEARKGRVEFRLDRTAIIHLPLGKLSFDSDRLMENLATVVETIVKARPRGAKGQYIKSVSLTTSMGPGIKLDLKTTLALRAP